MSFWQAIILAIVEGITEFLPVSSTGHMIICSSLMGIADQDFTKNYTVIIQFGAILSVIALYWKRFVDFRSFSFYIKLIIAFIPAAVFGLLLNDLIDSLLENVTVVAISLLSGGIFLLYVDRIFKEKDQIRKEPDYKNSFIIGLFQVISMIPGVSRSAATIIGGLSQGLTRQSAAEFSFFLAVPTMFAAMMYKLLKIYKSTAGFSDNDVMILLAGNVVAFVVAMMAIRSFINFLTKYGFKIFGYYRIFVGLTIILLQLFGFEIKIL